MVGSESTPECEQDVGGDIFMYKSKTLGSNSWEYVQRIEGFDARSCQMNVFHKDDLPEKANDQKSVYLHCRNLVCVSTNGPEGTYNCSYKLNMPNFYPKDDPTTRKVGGSNTFYDDDGSLYFVTSRVQRMKGGNRYTFIYKFKENDWTQIYEEPVASWHYDHRESPYLVKTKIGNKAKYFVFTSRTARWRNSVTTYLESDSLEGFSNKKKDDDEKVVVMHPADTDDIQSMGTQFGFIQNFGDDKWVFSGRRHPTEDPCNFLAEYGSHVMTSFQFDNVGVPHVYWKEYFDWQSTGYDPTDFEDHKVDSYKPTCVDTTKRFSIPNVRKKKKCAYVGRKRTKRRCKKEGVADKCQETCKVFYCNSGFCDKDYTKAKSHLKFCPGK